ncbi:hypothetical protein PAPYR_7549 [Paratrimastix pyriformis]|uniref:C2H2-type domain-containing protein n=1 Tax=Paratrimastix pyriformis TaxID=342808 RepID=A0ABQ8UF33_9EUKA|nr:hypothetical protein PAPYR_7549 [Paratrimastix pyriformis]
MEFACAKCDKTYKTAKSLKRHVNEKHSEGGEAANPTPTEQTKPAEPAPADVPDSVDDVSMGGDGGDGGDDEFFEQVRADAAFEMTHPDEIDDEPTKRKASTRSAPLDAPPPLPSIPLEEKIEAKKYAQETVTPDSLGTKHPQAISSMRERAEKEHLVAGLAKRLGIKEVQEADLRGMTDVELEAYHSQLRGKVDQKLVDALTHSDVMTDTYIAGVSGLVIAGGRYMKRDTTPVHGQLEANRPAISEAIKDWMRENPEPIAEDYNEEWSKQIREHGWDWMTAEEKLGHRISLNLYRQLATGKRDSMTNPEAVAVLAMMETSFREYTRAMAEYREAQAQWSASEAHLNESIESFQYAFSRNKAVEVPKGADRTLERYNRYNELEFLMYGTQPSRIGSRFWTTVDVNAWFMTFYQYPNNAAIVRFYSELAAHQSPPVNPEPISFGNVFFNTQTIDVSIVGNGSVSIGTMQLINASDSMFQVQTLATMTVQERAVASETARYYTALRHIAEVQNDHRMSLQAEAKTIAQRTAELRQMKATYSLLSDLGSVEKRYRMTLPEYGREIKFISETEASQRDLERIMLHLHESIEYDSAQLTESVKAFKTRKTQFDQLINSQLTTENTYHYEALRRISNEPTPVPAPAPVIPPVVEPPAPEHTPNTTLIASVATVLGLLMIA